MVTDVIAVTNNASHYDENPEYLIIGLVCLLIAGLISIMFSTWWYCVELKSGKKRPGGQKDPACRSCSNACKSSRFWKVCRFVLSLLTLGHVSRSIDGLICGIKNRRASNKCSCKKWYYVRTDHELDTAASLAVFEMFLEAIPTFVLQIYIVLMERDITISK